LLALGGPGVRPACAITQPGVRYRIDALLDTERDRIDGWATIHYRSGADTALPALYLHTYPNAFSGPHTIYAEEAVRVGEDYAVRLAKPKQRGWMTLDSASVDGEPVRVTVMETLARVDLPHPLVHGDSMTLRIHFRDKVPYQFDRFGRTGDAYSIAQWYPKLVVYDKSGWHLDPFHFMSEFYGEYATFDVAFTLPDAYWVGATGMLQSVEGGDNEVPFFPSRMPKDSVTVAVRVVPAGERAPAASPAPTLAEWKLETDLEPKNENGAPVEARLSTSGEASIRVPRGAPVHYGLHWSPSKPPEREAKEAPEAIDSEGRPGPLHLILATRDTMITDSLHIGAHKDAPGDTVLPSLKTLHYHAERVHDFALVACPDYVRADTMWAGIQVRGLVYRDDEPHWRDVTAYTVDAMRHYSQLVGPYVWPMFTSSEAFCGGGAMEYPMLVMNEPDQYSSLFHTLDDTNAHELGHNWFYGMLGSDERASPWLDEGFTQYVEHDYTDSKYPDGLFRYAKRYPWVGRISSLDEDEQSYLARAWARDEQPIATPADGYQGYPAYGVAAYGKPSSMLHTLRGILGDSVFVAFLHEYYRRNLLHHPRPEDVVSAASDVSGQDLEPFFREWIDTVDRPSFALGGIHRKREAGGGYRTAVTVRQKEEMALPVVVEARFADGSRQEKRVVATGREEEAAFESNAKLTGVRLDPRHEMVEMDRLDNATGVFPPMRAHFLYGFPTSEAIGVNYGPTVWYGVDEGMRLGGWFEGTYLPSRDFPQGIRGFEGGLNVGTNDGSVAYRAGAWRRWGFLGARSRVRGLVADDEGLFRIGLDAGNLITAPSRRHPFRTWAASVQYRDRDDLDPVDSRYWSLGRTLEGTFSLGLETIGARHGEHVGLSYRHGASVFRPEGDTAPDANYDRVDVTAAQHWNVPLRGGFDVRWSATAGSAFRRVPREIQFDVAEAGRLDALPYFYANDRGPLRETDHFLVPGGGGLRGYAGDAVLGQRIAAANLEAARHGDPFYLFGDVGRVEASGLGEDEGTPLHPLVGRTLADAGIAFQYGPVEVAFPAWVGRPPADENPWDFRWKFSIGTVSLPRL